MTIYEYMPVQVMSGNRCSNMGVTLHIQEDRLPGQHPFLKITCEDLDERCLTVGSKTLLAAALHAALKVLEVKIGELPLEHIH